MKNHPPLVSHDFTHKKELQSHTFGHLAIRHFISTRQSMDHFRLSYVGLASGNRDPLGQQLSTYSQLNSNSRFCRKLSSARNVVDVKFL